MGKWNCEGKMIWGPQTDKCRHENDAALCEHCFADLSRDHGWTEDFLVERMERQAQLAQESGCHDHAANIRSMIARRKHSTKNGNASS